MKGRFPAVIGWTIFFSISTIAGAAATVDGPSTALKALAKEGGILIGSAVDYSALVREPIYSDTLSREVSALTPEHEMKWARMRPQQLHYNFSQPGAMMAFAASNDLVVHGHALVWHRQVPEWLSAGTFTREEMIDILRSNIYTVAGRYRGRYLV